MSLQASQLAYRVRAVLDETSEWSPAMAVGEVTSTESERKTPEL